MNRSSVVSMVTELRIPQAFIKVTSHVTRSAQGFTLDQGQSATSSEDVVSISSNSTSKTNVLKGGIAP